MNDRKVYWAHECPQDVVEAIENAEMDPKHEALNELMEPKQLNIKDIVKDNRVYFQFYRQQVMYYEICCYDGQKYTFPVPLEDVMDASLFAQEKAITYMRYIRKAIDEGTFVVSGCC